MALNSMEIAQMAREFQKTYVAPATTKSTERVKVVAGSKKIGDTINGYAITGFGQAWSQTVRDCDTSAYGLEPGMDHRVTVQYAYLSSEKITPIDAAIAELTELTTMAIAEPETVEIPATAIRATCENFEGNLGKRILAAKIMNSQIEQGAHVAIKI